MNWQEIIVLLLFAGSLFYLGLFIYRTIKKGNCASKCSGCKIPDFSKIK